MAEFIYQKSVARRRVHDDEEIVCILDISNKNISDFISSDSHYEISDADTVRVRVAQVWTAKQEQHQ
jgi:hypothetical protein